MRRVSEVLKEEYGEKVYRLSLQSGCTCPNRDGSLLDEYGNPLLHGCAFCSTGGSGEFAEAGPLKMQLAEAKRRIGQKTDARKFIAYFQSFSNTYGDVERLKKLYFEAVSEEDVVILSLGTRPDCLPEEMLAMLTELNRIKPVWVELGLQTAHDRTAAAFHRGYPLKTFEEAYRRLRAAGITVIVHVMFGLPGETREEMLGTIRYLAALKPTLEGIKIHMLQVLRGTELGEQYEQDPFPLLSLEEYAELVAESLRILPESTVLHRMTGDGPRELLLAPLWSLRKKHVLNTMNKIIGEVPKGSVQKNFTEKTRKK